MFSLEVVDTDRFLEMSLSAQSLYFHLGMRADDEGFVTPQKVMRVCGAAPDDLKVLIAKGFVHYFEDGVIVITHWKANNYLQADRFTLSQYHGHLERLPEPISNVYNVDTKRIQSVSRVDTQDRIGKDRKESPQTPQGAAPRGAVSEFPGQGRRVPLMTVGNRRLYTQEEVDAWEGGK